MLGHRPSRIERGESLQFLFNACLTVLQACRNFSFSTIFVSLLILNFPKLAFKNDRVCYFLFDPLPGAFIKGADFDRLHCAGRVHPHTMPAWAAVVSVIVR